jgi:hypothetical protein
MFMSIKLTDTQIVMLTAAAPQSDDPPTISATRKLKKAQRSEKPQAQQVA